MTSLIKISLYVVITLQLRTMIYTYIRNITLRTRTLIYTSGRIHHMTSSYELTDLLFFFAFFYFFFCLMTQNEEDRKRRKPRTRERKTERERGFFFWKASLNFFSSLILFWDFFTCYLLERESNISMFPYIREVYSL